MFYFRVEEKFAGGKFREIPCAVDIYFSGGRFRAKSKFANIAKISSTRKIRVIQYTRAKNEKPNRNICRRRDSRCVILANTIFLNIAWHIGPIDN